MTILRTLKLVMFHILLSSRWLVLIISKFFGAAFLIVFIMSISIENLATIPAAIKIMMILFGAAFTSVYWFYDYLILHLKPKMIDIILIK